MEMLAVIVVIAIIGGIATTSFISTINTSKLKSEKIFIDKLSNLIDDYLDLYPPTYINGTTYSFDKCRDNACADTYSVTANQVLKSDGSLIYLKDLIAKNIIEDDKLVNPKNKKQCFDTANPEIKVYKDSDYVYYYYVDLTGTNTDCNISNENSIINTLPDNLKSKVGLS